MKARIWLYNFFGQNLAIFQVWSQKKKFLQKRNLKFNPDNATTTTTMTFDDQHTAQKEYVILLQCTSDS